MEYFAVITPGRRGPKIRTFYMIAGKAPIFIRLNKSDFKDICVRYDNDVAANECKILSRHKDLLPTSWVATIHDTAFRIFMIRMRHPKCKPTWMCDTIRNTFTAVCDDWETQMDFDDFCRYPFVLVPDSDTTLSAYRAALTLSYSKLLPAFWRVYAENSQPV